MNMTAKDFVMTSMNKNSTFGIQGYELVRTRTNFDKDGISRRINPGDNIPNSKKTFVDDITRITSLVPGSKYKISYDWSGRGIDGSNTLRPDFSKEFRHTMATDIERKAEKDQFAEPCTYSPRHKLVQKSLKGCYVLNEHR